MTTLIALALLALWTKSCVEDGMRLKAEKELAARAAELQLIDHELPLCLLEVEELRRVRDIRLARERLEHAARPASVQAMVPSPETKVAREEQGTVVRCRSLAAYRLDLTNGVPFDNAKSAHIERLTAQSMEMLKDFYLAPQK